MIRSGVNPRSCRLHSTIKRLSILLGHAALLSFTPESVIKLVVVCDLLLRKQRVVGGNTLLALRGSCLIRTKTD